MPSSQTLPFQGRLPQQRAESILGGNDFLAPKMRELFFAPGPPGQSPVYVRSRDKTAHGGRGSAKSWGHASMASVLGSLHPTRILCVRETQTSMRQSIHKLLSNRIEELGLARYYDVQAEVILGKYKTRVLGKYTRTEMAFAGIRTEPAKIKGFEAPDICLIEEGESVSKESWRNLRPTVRNKQGNSEIWCSFNPRRQDDPTSIMYIERPLRRARIVEMNWSDNPWFPADLEIERQGDLDLIRNARDESERLQLQLDYEHVWEGAYQRRSAASVIRPWIGDEVFDDPDPELQTVYRYGADWGFANDPTALVRLWITEHTDGVKRWQEMWVSHEAFGRHVELNEIASLFDGDVRRGWPGVPGVRRWHIKADCSRPETISHVAAAGFNISGAEKWPGSVEDGIAHINRFRTIHIHERCRELKKEAQRYSYKVDKVTEEVLPIIVDAHNHGWDAVRYALDGYIQRGGRGAMWARLGQ